MYMDICTIVYYKTSILLILSTSKKDEVAPENQTWLMLFFQNLVNEKIEIRCLLSLMYKIASFCIYVLICPGFILSSFEGQRIVGLISVFSGLCDCCAENANSVYSSHRRLDQRRHKMRHHPMATTTKTPSDWSTPTALLFLTNQIVLIIASCLSCTRLSLPSAWPPHRPSCSHAPPTTILLRSV